MSPGVADFPFDLLTAVVKFIRRLLDSAIDVDFESAWVIWDLIEIAILVAATLLFFGLLRRLVHKEATENDKAGRSATGHTALSPFDAALEVVELLQGSWASTAAGAYPENQRIRNAAKVLLSIIRDGEGMYPLVAEVARGERMVIGQSLVDQFVSLAAKCRGSRSR